MNIFSAFSSLFSLVISRPLGFILGLCYHLTRNYGLSLILFTIITRICLLPLAIKQQKSMAENVRLQPKISQIQKKYAKDKQKLNEETMKLYQEEGFNPMGGCLPLLIQMPILIGLFNVIYRPLSYMVGLSKTTIDKIITELWPEIQTIAGGSLGKGVTLQTAINNPRVEIYAANAMKGNMDRLSFLPSNTVSIDFKFLGLDLSSTMNGIKLTVLLIIPILCYITSLISSWYSMRMQKQTMPAGNAAGAAGMNKSMLLIMPLVSAYFATTVPAGVGFYWICTNLFMILQTWGMNILYNPVKLAEKSEEASKKRKIAKRSAMQKTGKSAEIESVSSAPAEVGEEKGTVTAEAPAPVEEVYEEPKKKTKKQLMEENRRRLSQARNQQQEK